MITKYKKKKTNVMLNLFQHLKKPKFLLPFLTLISVVLLIGLYLFKLNSFYINFLVAIFGAILSVYIAYFVIEDYIKIQKMPLKKFKCREIYFSIQNLLYNFTYQLHFQIREFNEKENENFESNFKYGNYIKNEIISKIIDYLIHNKNKLDMNYSFWNNFWKQNKENYHELKNNVEFLLANIIDDEKLALSTKNLLESFMLFNHIIEAKRDCFVSSKAETELFIDVFENLKKFYIELITQLTDSKSS
ncbi:MAG: hypothetical protein PHV68_01035 [Candidatus Gastranaerophilales bacterium]|nr:hypothetical protein [Candidatus Gastranaerophilales bacterium]